MSNLASLYIILVPKKSLAVLQDKMNDTLYWTALLIGLVAVMVAYFWSRSFQLEGFEAQLIPDDFNEITNEASSFNTRFPYFGMQKVFAYISCFSKVLTRGDKTMPVYEVDAMRWRDMVNTNDFNIQTSITLPTSLTTSTSIVGLPLKDVKLENVSPSEAFGRDPATGAYDLGMFSVTFFMKWNDVVKTTDPMVLFEMFAETPNYVAWRFKNVTATNVVMEVILGDVSTSYTWVVPISTLQSNGNSTLYSLVYDNVEKVIRIFIGVNEYKKEMDEVNVIKLSNSKMAINTNKNIDADLKAFVFFKNVALTTSDIGMLSDYFIRESGGSTAIIGQKEQELKAAVTETDEIRQALLEAQKQLSTCKATPEEKPAETPKTVSNYDKWNLKTDFPIENIPVEDLKKCSPLEVKKFGDAKQDSPLEKQLPPDLASKYTSKKPFDDYDIVNPITNPPAAPAPPAPSTTVPPTETTSTNTTTPTNTEDNKKMDDLYTALVNEVTKQKNITDQTEKKADANPATPVNDEKDTNVVEQVSFFEYLARYLV